MNGHPQHDEFFDLYALGVIEGAECDEFRAHLASCDECARKLAEAQGRIASLSFALEPVQPPAGVKERLMRQVRAESERQRAGVKEAGTSVGRGWGGWGVGAGPRALAVAIAPIYLWNSNSHLNQMIQDENAQMQSLRNELDEANELMELETAHDTV